jgi:hypothetical protein
MTFIFQNESQQAGPRPGGKTIDFVLDHIFRRIGNVSSQCPKWRKQAIVRRD